MDGPPKSPSLALVGVLISLPAAVVAIWLTRRKSNRTQHPSPPTGPNFSELIATITGNNLLEKQMQWVEKYGKLFRVPSPLPWLLSDLVICADADLMKLLLSTHVNNYQSPYAFSRPKPFSAAVASSFGRSITSMVGEEWRWRRVALLKEFHRNRLLDEDRELFEAIIAAGQELRQNFDRACETGETLRIDVLAARASVDIFFYLLVGKKLDCDVSSIRAAAYTLLGFVVYTLSTPFAWLNPLKHREMVRKKNAAREVLDRIVRAEVEALLQETKAACAAVDAAVAADASPEEVRKIYDEHLPERPSFNHRVPANQ